VNLPDPARSLSALNAIVDADAAGARGWSLPDLARAYLAGGVRFLQIRAKTEPSGRLLDACDAVVAEARGCGAVVIINDRADLARLARADGVHVGQTDLPPAAVRTLLGPAAIVGLSTHTAAQIDAALAEPISYVAVGPVFGTGTKETGYPPVGLDLVRYAASGGRAGRRLPVVAIGGITLDRATAVLAAGATAVAVIGDLLAGGDPEARAREYVRRLAG